MDAKARRIIIHQDVYVCLALAAGGLYLYSLLGEMIPASTRFPRLMLFTFFFFLICIFIQGVKKSVAATREQNPAGTKLLIWDVVKMPFAVFAVTSAYVALMMLIGFFPATAVFVPALMLFFKYMNWKIILISTVGTLLFVYAIFILILGATLP